MPPGPWWTSSFPPLEMATEVACAPPEPVRVGAATQRVPGARPRAALEPNATLIDRQDLTPTMARLRVRPDDGPPAFRAGQYFAIGLPVEGRWIQRPYSAACSPSGIGALDFLVRLVPGGALTPHLWRLRPGERVRLGPPRGLFALQPDDPRRHLFLSTGTGIAPLLAMLDSLLGRPGPGPQGTRRPAPIVIHGVATAPELADRARLERLAADGAIDYVPAVSRPTDPANHGWSGRAGRLDALIGVIAAEAELDADSTVAFLCGNPAMIAAVTPRLAALGLPADAVRAEPYWTPSAD